MSGTAKQIARWTALGALFLIPLTPLIVANGFFFPFITAKAFYFRSLVEITVCAWAVLALLDTEYRPRFSWVGAAVLAFVLWMFVADAFAINAFKAFWSNLERMEGWVLLIHLLGFFFAASAVLRTERKWRGWFLTSLAVSLVVSAHALLQLSGALSIHQGSIRIDASFGNSAYLAIYLLFNVFIALWLAFGEKRIWLRWGLIALAALEAVFIFFTETRGTVLGLVGALLLAALLTAVTGGRRARRLAAGAFVLILVLAGGFFLARNSSFVQNNSSLQRIASVSLADGQTRFTIWHMAWEGFLESPVVGWGQEGFNYVFNKFYESSLYTQEPWFDRAHNAFLDWLTAGGAPAFLLYLSLFITALIALWRSSTLARAERVLLTAALAGYACHNLFVFDNLYSYVYFFAILALIDAQLSRPIQTFESAPALTGERGLTYALPLASVAALILIWFVNVPGLRVGTELITALSPSPSGLSANLATFEDLAAHPAFAAQEVREQIVSFANMLAQNPNVPADQKQSFATLAVAEISKEVAAHPRDARARLELVFAYRTLGDTPGALKELQAAALLSPGKEDIYVQQGVAEWDAGDVKAAQAAFSKAYTLGPQFSDLAAAAAAGDFVAGDAAAGDALLIKAFGTTVADSDILASAYYRTKAWGRLIALWQMRASKPGASAQTLFGLAAAYYAAGEKAQAIAAIQHAIEVYPQAASAGAAAIAQIKAGQ
ncbi:O-antigen ligase family protein [Candidatus Kaiserbacteria bacterium]|nr:O-antigen ligase family protein [Candidatus Kaiserbacteria bacterium]